MFLCYSKTGDHILNKDWLEIGNKISKAPGLPYSSEISQWGLAAAEYPSKCLRRQS